MICPVETQPHTALPREQSLQAQHLPHEDRRRPNIPYEASLLLSNSSWNMLSGPAGLHCVVFTVLTASRK